MIVMYTLQNTSISHSIPSPPLQLRSIPLTFATDKNKFNGTAMQVNYIYMYNMYGLEIYGSCCINLSVSAVLWVR